MRTVKESWIYFIFETFKKILLNADKLLRIYQNLEFKKLLKTKMSILDHIYLFPLLLFAVCMILISILYQLLFFCRFLIKTSIKREWWWNGTSSLMVNTTRTATWESGMKNTNLLNPQVAWTDKYGNDLYFSRSSAAKCKNVILQRAGFWK